MYGREREREVGRYFRGFRAPHHQRLHRLTREAQGREGKVRENTFEIRENTFNVRENTFDVRENTCNVRENTFEIRENTFHVTENTFHVGENTFYREHILEGE